MARKKKSSFRKSGGRRSAASPPISIPDSDLGAEIRAVEAAMAVAPLVRSRWMSKGFL